MSNKRLSPIRYSFQILITGKRKDSVAKRPEQLFSTLEVPLESEEGNDIHPDDFAKELREACEKQIEATNQLSERIHRQYHYREWINHQKKKEFKKAVYGLNDFFSHFKHNKYSPHDLRDLMAQACEHSGLTADEIAEVIENNEYMFVE